jgi:hypothetical protein
LCEPTYNSETGGLNDTADNLSSSFVTVTAVPEPSALVLACLGGVLAAIRGRLPYRPLR